MKVIPAIDLIDGKCVRLTQGNYNCKKKYFDDPIRIAKSFEQQGATMIHIIDLDGARLGRSINADLICEIVDILSIPVQVGGGVRDLRTAQQYLDNRVDRIIIGTAAIKQPELVARLLKKYGAERIVVSLDIKEDEVVIEGWMDSSELSLNQAVKRIYMLGVRELIITDVSKDGMLAGPNIELVRRAEIGNMKVMIAGGVANDVDIQRCEQAGLDGVIIGKAIYEGRISQFQLEADSFRKDAVSNLTKRIIPCMDIADGRVVKGINFKQLQDAGDPVELAKLYSNKGADELVFLDITATIENRLTLYELVEKVAAQINIPFTVGGGIRILEDIGRLLKFGADKVSIGSTAVTNSDFVKQAAERFGTQCIVISIDSKQVGDSWEIYIKGGREATGIDAIKFARKMERLGAGELLVNSLDRDGTKQGYDLALMQTISTAVNIPIIASSGVGKSGDFLDVFSRTDVDAALAASVFHSRGIDIQRLKKYLLANNIKVRI